MWQRRPVGMWAMSVAVCVALLACAAAAAEPADQAGAVAGHHDFTILEADGKYCAKDEATGSIQFTGTDARAVIAGAISAISRAGGGVLRFAPGHYQVMPTNVGGCARGINVGGVSDLTVVLHPRATLEMVPNPALPYRKWGNELFTFTKCSRIRIVGNMARLLGFWDHSLGGDSEATAIVFNECKNVNLEGVQFEKWQQAVRMDGCIQGKVEACIANLEGSGLDLRVPGNNKMTQFILVVTCTSVRVLGNQMVNTSDDSIEVEHSNGVELAGNYIVKNSNDPSFGANCIIVDAQGDKRTCKNVTIHDNYLVPAPMNDNAAIRIIAAVSGSTVENVTIHDNTIDQEGYTGGPGNAANIASAIGIKINGFCTKTDNAVVRNIDIHDNLIRNVINNGVIIVGIQRGTGTKNFVSDVNIHDNQFLDLATVIPAGNTFPISAVAIFSESSSTGTLEVSRIRIAGNVIRNSIPKGINGFGYQAVGPGITFADGCAFTVESNTWLSPSGSFIKDASGSNVLLQHSMIRGNRGYNPVGYISPDPSVGASPCTYTNKDGVPEAVQVSGGAVRAITKDGQTLVPYPLLVDLDPGESITIEYTAAPTIKRWGH